MATVSFPSWQIAARVLASTLGAYAFTWGFIAFGVMLLFAAGMRLEEASSLMTMLGFLLFLSMFFWAYLAARLSTVCWVLGGGGGAMSLGGWMLSRILV